MPYFPPAASSSTYGNLYAEQGGMLNGKIVTSVASSDLTVAIKTLANTDPSASDPVYVRIGNTVRSITAALSVTKNDGTNWFNSGASETAALEVDYFVYLGYNATDGVVIGFARIPYGRVYSDFSATTTNEKYCAISTITTAASTDEYENVGRFNATLSATAAFLWTIPATSIVISRPIYETRWLTFTPTYSVDAPMTYSSVATRTALYQLMHKTFVINLGFGGTTGVTASSSIYATIPLSIYNGVGNDDYYGGGTTIYDSGWKGGNWSNVGGNKIPFRRYDSANWNLGASKFAFIQATFPHAI